MHRDLENKQTVQRCFIIRPVSLILFKLQCMEKGLFEKMKISFEKRLLRTILSAFNFILKVKLNQC